MPRNEQQAETENLSDGLVASPPQPEPNTLPPPPPQQQLYIPGHRLPYSNAQPVWQFILLNLCTLTLYQFVWFFRNWYLLKIELGLHINPLGRTIFAPLFSWSFFSNVKRLAGADYAWPLGIAGPPFFAMLYTILVVFGYTIDRVNRDSNDIAALTFLSMILSFSTILPLVPAVQALNTYWEKEQPGRPMRRSLSAGAIVTVVIGAMVLLVMLSELIR